MRSGPRPKIELVTFTGADDETSESQIHQIAETAYYVGVPVELAFLVSFSEDALGRARYPRPDTVLAHMAAASSRRAQVALHLCGAAAGELLRGRFDSAQWRSSGWLPALAHVAILGGRIQLNARAELTYPAALVNAQRLIARELGWAPERIEVVGQHRDPASWPASPELGIRYLYDCSGGRGVAPSSWPDLPPGELVGLAGGLGVSCDGDPLPALGSVLTHIDAAPEGARVWIDMETNIRDTRPDAQLTNTGGAGYFSSRMCGAVLGHPLIRKLATRYD